VLNRLGILVEATHVFLAVAQGTVHRLVYKYLTSVCIAHHTLRLINSGSSQVLLSVNVCDQVVGIGAYSYSNFKPSHIVYVRRSIVSVEYLKDAEC
jgi:hypothetical protein